ncbi:MAG: ferrous iron transport protein B, partial [Nannocystaceae bacterium]|nr:ferrous iron transport protein B [Nannocystaceae bacterium]
TSSTASGARSDRPERTSWASVSSGAVEVLSGRSDLAPDAVLLVLDATNLARNLYLALQVLELGIPCVIALNMVDLANKVGAPVGRDELSAALGVPVVETVGRDGKGVGQVLSSLLDLQAAAVRRVVDVQDPMLAELEALVGPVEARRRLTLGMIDRNASKLPPSYEPRLVEQAVEKLVSARYAEVDRILESVVSRSARSSSVMRHSERIDRVLTHRVAGPLTFVAVMALVFQAMFSWAEPFMRAIETTVAWAQGQLVQRFGEGLVVDLLTHGVIAGIGNVVVFVPQVAILFALVAVLEDSGYMARAAFIIDRVMAKAGLSGSSFVPLLSGYACAIPAILGTRTIRSMRERMVTMLMIPFVSCSARLPIYALLIGAFFAADEVVWGPLRLGGLLLLGLYTLSTVSALLMGLLYKRTILRGPRLPLFVELPPYRLPRLKNIAVKVWDRTWGFLRGAGTTILTASVVMWALLTFPRPIDAPGPNDPPAIEHSIGGRVGKAMEPALAPMGQDWRIGVGILGSFAAREVFVSTLGLVFGIENADEDDAPLRERLRRARDPRTGAPLYSPLSATALMVFFVYASQCMSTLAVIRRETRSWRWPLFVLGSMTLIAYLAAVATFQIGIWLGWGLSWSWA